MRSVLLILKLVFFLLVLGLAVQNSATVEVHHFFGRAWSLPLALVIFLAFTAGLLVGMLACVSRLIRSHREIIDLRKQQKVE
ncbi:MAG: LapA family protein [Pseudomonadota bacterium]